MTENYRILSLLGSGGFSNVFLAEHRGTQARVAIKILNDAHGDERFAREAATLSALESPNTVRLIEFGRSVSGPFMVFEYVEGAESLQDFIDHTGRIPWQAAVHLTRQMLVSLAEAHGMGVIHRDIKPANMLLTRDGQIKVLDFGLVRLLPTLYDVSPLTRTGTVLGTPRYMAPEVMRGVQAAEPCADIFAVGMIAHQLLTGEPPNMGRSAYEVIARHLDPEPYEVPNDVELPFAIRAWVDSMMRKDVARRVPDAATALRELEERLLETPELSGPFSWTFGSDEPLVAIEPPERDLSLAGYTLGSELGRGATATVWEAHDRWGAAAVKFLLAGLASGVRDAFLAEARAHAGLEHPNIVRLLDYGHVVEADDPPQQTQVGDPYLVMELATGTLREEGLPTNFSQTLNILLQVLDALAFAHARGVIHRDLKPENVLCFGEGTYKVADFGIAHSLRATTQATAATLAESIGTPRYMSPEQFRGRTYDYGPATDLYALGCLAYELVVGRVPFGGPRLIDIASQHESQPMPIPVPRFEVPAGLAGWLARLLAKRPHDRFEAAADAAWQLRQIAAGFVGGDDASKSDFRSPIEPTFISSERRALSLHPGKYLTVLDGAWDSPPAEQAPHTEVAAVHPAPIEPPPVPSTWRRQASDSARLEGLGLFALRELPLAGHDGARDILWQALRDAHERGELVPLVLTGGPGAPVSQLGAWFAARAAEVGAAHAVLFSHTLAGAPREGLAGAVEDLFGTWALSDDAAAALVRSKFADDPLLPREIGTTDAEILAHELQRARGARPNGNSSEHERFSAFARVLRRKARRRPLVLFLDQLQYSGESTAFLRYLLEEEGDLPAVVVVGKRGPAPRASLERDLEALTMDPRCRAIAVRSYDDAEFEEFAELLLPMARGLVAVLSTVCERDPAMTQLAVADLIDRRVLEREGERFAPTRLIDPSELRPATVIERRINRLNLDEEARFALTVCAITNEAPDLAEVRAVCDRLGTTSPDGLEAALEEVGLARSSGAGWWFAPRVVEHLISGADDADKRRIRRACGQAIVERTAPDDAESWSRAARYFIDAEAGEDALEPLYRAVRLFVSRDLEAADALVVEREALLLHLDIPTDEPPWIDQLNLQSVVAKIRGDRASAMEYIEAAHDLAQARGYSRGLARALRDSAAVAVDLGNLGEATARFDRAAAISAEASDFLDEAHAWFGAGFVEYRRGNLDTAEARYRAAIARYKDVGAQQGRARAMSYLSAAYVAGGRYEEAREQATAAQDLARSCGALSIVAETKSDLAEIARFTGDYDRARSLYEETARWQRLAGSRSVGAITELNLALVDLGQAQYERATHILERLERDVRELGLVARLPLIRIARLAAIVGAGGGQADEVVRQSGELLAVSEPDRDIAWAYECGVRAAANHPTRREWFRARATSEYERLGDQARARAVRAM